MQNSEIIMIIAILLAPVIAIQVQKWLETWKEKAERKKKIFYTLMATRATRISPEHVSALNMIDLEFEEETVCEKWREYVDYLNESPQMPSADATEQQHQEYRNKFNIWSSKLDDMFIELLYEMSKVLNYKFDKVYLKKSVYYPRGLSELELDQQTLRRAAVSFFSGLHPVNMNVTSFPSPEENPEVLEFQTKCRSFMTGLMEGKNKIPVSMETKNFNENF